jgi:hypothetical protein
MSLALSGLLVRLTQPFHLTDRLTWVAVTLAVPPPRLSLQTRNLGFQPRILLGRSLRRGLDRHSLLMGPRARALGSKTVRLFASVVGLGAGDDAGALVPHAPLAGLEIGARGGVVVGWCEEGF